MSDENKEIASTLDQKLQRKPDKERLKNKGLIEEKEDVAVAKMNKDASKAILETKLHPDVRPEKAVLEAKGKIKDKETHEAQKAEKKKTKADLENSLTVQPTRANLHTTGKIQIQFDPRGHVEDCKEIFTGCLKPGEDTLNV